MGTKTKIEQEEFVNNAVMIANTLSKSLIKLGIAKELELPTLWEGVIVFCNCTVRSILKSPLCTAESARLLSLTFAELSDECIVRSVELKREEEKSDS